MRSIGVLYQSIFCSIYDSVPGLYWHLEYRRVNHGGARPRSAPAEEQPNGPKKITQWRKAAPPMKTGFENERYLQEQTAAILHQYIILLIFTPFSGICSLSVRSIRRSFIVQDTWDRSSLNDRSFDLIFVSMSRGISSPEALLKMVRSIELYIEEAVYGF